MYPPVEVCCSKYLGNGDRWCQVASGDREKTIVSTSVCAPGATTSYEWQEQRLIVIQSEPENRDEDDEQ